MFCRHAHHCAHCPPSCVGHHPRFHTLSSLPLADTPAPLRIPNLPFFYLVYRAWSHWRALSGGKHIQFLLSNNLLALTPSPVVDRVYAEQKGPLPSTPETTTNSTQDLVSNPDSFSRPNGARDPDGETMLLSQANGKEMTQVLDLPQLEVELERAIWQVEEAIKERSADVAAKKSDETTDEDENKLK